MRMSRKEALDYINSHPEQHLQRDRKGRGWICPLCGNGSGSDGDGLAEDKRHPHHWKCFHCGFYGDMIELIAREHGIDGGSAEAFRAAREAYSIELTEEAKAAEMSREIIERLDGYDKEEKPAGTIIEYIMASRKKIQGAAGYLAGRGISLATAERMFLGYDEKRKAVVIPTKDSAGNLTYVLRYLSPEMKMRYQNAEGLSVGLFNRKALDGEGAVFVVEGAFDALSIEELGFRAVALNSGSNIEQFFKQIDAYKTNGNKEERNLPKLLLAMDNDEAGFGFAETLSEGLKARFIEFQVVNVCPDHKDANEAIQADSERLRMNLYRACHPDKAQEVESHKIAALLPDFKKYVQDSANNHAIPTGFDNLDKAIGGGLFSKLYVIGAKSSVGKTAFSMQIADNVAARGADVLIFSMEMAKEDLIARSISRYTYGISQERKDSRLAKTELGITAFERYAHYSEAEREVIGEAHSQYAEAAGDHISIYEGRKTADQIRETVNQYIAYTGKRPLVVVDYLQVIKPSEELTRGTIREQIDDALEKFLVMRRECKIPVIVISSFNRGSYGGSADNAAFKESGAIEYSADATIALEIDKPRAKGDLKDEENRQRELEGMRNDVRKIKLTFLKNRGNRVGSELHFLYNAKFNYFEKDATKDDVY